MWFVNGLPLIKVDQSDSEITFDINLRNDTYNITNGTFTSAAPTADSYVWFSDQPFTGWPNDQDCLDFEPLNSSCETTTLTNFNKAVKVPVSRGGVAKVKIKAPTAKRYVWVKWATNGTYGGGTLVVPSSVIVETTA